MNEILRRSGQEYVDPYAQDAKKRERDAEREAAKAVARAESDEVWEEIKPD
jgi:1-acyl-sn-glycerol-3-phosphate acyltransferase